MFFSLAGVRSLPDENFKHNPNSQFIGDDIDGFPDGQLSAIDNQKRAVQALELVIEQGEGHQNTKDSHVDVFSELSEKAKKNSWDVHQVPEDPKTVGYQANPYIYKVKSILHLYPS